MLLVITSFIVLLANCIYLYFVWTYNYWRNQNVHNPRPSFPKGNIGNQTRKKRNVALDIADIYKNMKAEGYKYGGLFMFDEPVFLPVDLNLMKNMLTKDFAHFMNHGVYSNEAEPLSANLFLMEGDRWKSIRRCVSPAFAIGRIKGLLEVLLKTATEMEQEIEKSKVFNIRDVSSRFMANVVAIYYFGIEADCFKNPKSEILHYCKKSMESSINIWILLTMLYPKLAKFFNIKSVQPEVSKYFTSIINQTIESRKKNSVKRNDVMQILIDGYDNKTLSKQEIWGQAFILFVAGFETTTLTMTYCLFELAWNLQIQDRVRQEINSVLARYKNKCTYEAVSEMKYLDQVINETLRKYPPSPILLRSCNKDYKIPDTDFTLEKDTKIFIPVYGIHHDEEYYSEPEKFDPDRFSDENKNNIAPFSFIPFGDGPRLCIGSKFGLLQVKIAVLKVIAKFKIRINSDTPSSITINPTSLTTSTVQQLCLDIDMI